ncbi:hypothetical protein BCR35DRAFT_276583, partial [Leucosporidium creatinivorum]
MLVTLRLLLHLSTFVFASPTAQLAFAPNQATTWTALGPFPLGSREGPLLPPLLPNLTRRLHPSPLADGGYIEAVEVQEDSDGWVQVGAENIRWQSLRSSAGWSVLQHQVYYERVLSVGTASLYSLDLDTAAEFSILKVGSDPSERRWYNGNMYGYPEAAPHFVELERGDHLITVTFAYDLRISGDSGGDGIPRSRWRLVVEKEERQLSVDSAKTVAPSVVEGVLMGEVLGIELSNRWRDEIELLCVKSEHGELKVILPAPVKLAPLQTRLIALSVHQKRPLTPAFKGHLPLTLLVSRAGVKSSLSTTIRLPVSRLSTSEPSPILSTFLSNTDTPSYAVYTPPKTATACSSVALLALHGAGVDPATSPSWTSSIKQREREWIVWPLGLSAWGYDWHGASVKDVEAAISHLQDIQRSWKRAHGLSDQSCPRAKKLVVLGHSNGGQGAWHYMSHFPDRVLGGVPASGYVKIQDYVPYHLSLGQHYRDPTLTGILSAGLSPFDEDLYASNLVGILILNRHGAEDDNVPVQHSRQLVSIIDEWSRGNSSTIYSEVSGAGHWFDEVLNAPIVNRFLDHLISHSNRSQLLTNALEFTLTTANPDESGSKLGFRILELEAPGRLARIEVEVYDLSKSPRLVEDPRIRLRTTNVRSFSFGGAVFEEALGFLPRALAIDNHSPIPLTTTTTTFSTDGSNPFTIHTPTPRRYGPLISILSSPRPLVLVVGTSGSPSTTRHLTSIAERIAHDAYLYGRVDCEVVRDDEVDETPEGNVALLGDSYANSVTARWAKSWPTPVSFVSPSAFAINDRLFETPGQGLLFLTAHPSHPSSLVLVLAGVGAEGLERAARLFPVRTGVPLPDFVVTAPSMTSGGVEAAGFWTSDWAWSDKASY